MDTLNLEPTAIVPGSNRESVQGTVFPFRLVPEPVEVTVYLKPTAGTVEYDLMERFADAHLLTIVKIDIDAGSVKLKGAVSSLQQAFGVQLENVLHGSSSRNIRTREGPVSVPEALAPHILGVLGLDNRPVVRYYAKLRSTDTVEETDVSAAHFRTGALTAPQVAGAYSFPKELDGSGSTIAILEFGGGFRPADLDKYFTGLGIKQPLVTAVSVDGAINAPGDPADAEVLLDIEVAGAIAPGANYLVYFAPNTDRGYADAVLAVAHDKRAPQVLIICWGAPETSWTGQALAVMEKAFQDCAALGITVLAASGDSGASDGTNKLSVDYPASSPFVTACGGTKLTKQETGWNEHVWCGPGDQGGGGGISALFDAPIYQGDLLLPKLKNGGTGRGVPDIAGNASPDTGYKVIINGAAEVVGGTSAVAPLYGGLIALVLQSRKGKAIGLLNPALYKLPPDTFSDVLLGDNIDSKAGGYSAATGWDAASGLGSVVGSKLCDRLP